jgi:hypothetical protein
MVRDTYGVLGGNGLAGTGFGKGGILSDEDVERYFMTIDVGNRG